MKCHSCPIVSSAIKIYRTDLRHNFAPLSKQSIYCFAEHIATKATNQIPYHCCNKPLMLQPATVHGPGRRGTVQSVRPQRESVTDLSHNLDAQLSPVHERHAGRQCNSYLP